MLTENDVVEAVAKHLQEEGWQIVHKLTTIQRGIDIVAERPSRRMLIEAKGEGSSKAHTARFGKSFLPGQVVKHIPVAFFTAARLQVKNPSAEVAMAFPNTTLYRKCVDEIMPVLQRLGIGVFFVAPDLSVNVAHKARPFTEPNT